MGESFGRALFGDPAAARAQQEQQAKAALMAAQTERETAHGQLYSEQAGGQRYQNSSAASLPDLIASFVGAQRPQQPQTLPGADPLAALPEAPMQDPQAVQRSLGAIIAAIGGAQGDKIDTSEMMGSLGAFLGGDELARRGLVAQGQTPGKDFAITSDRADTIRDDTQGASFDQATGVARINHANDIPIATMRDGTTRRGQDLSTSDRRRGQDIGSDDRLRGQDMKGIGGYDREGAKAVGSQFGTVTSTSRTAEHNKKVGGVANSYHLESRGGRGIDIARAPGVSHQQVVAGYKAQGFTILEQLDEGDHSHLALSGGPNAKGGAAKPPKGISKASVDMIKKEVTDQLASNRANADGGVTTFINERAIRYYQETGNPVGSVRRAVGEAMASHRQNTAAKHGDERAAAMAAIAKGAPRAAVAARYKQNTGQEFDAPASPSAGGGANGLRAEARAAIAAGRDPVAAAARFQKLTGQAL